MVAHDCKTHNPYCFRCDLSREEALLARDPEDLTLSELADLAFGRITPKETPMPDHTGSITAVEFGRTTIDEEYDDGTTKLGHHDEPGTYTLTVTGLPEDIEWSNGMTVTISRPPHPHAPERISYSNGTDQLDEIYLRNVDVHIEQMDSNYYWMCFRRGTDRLTVNLGAKRAPVNGTVDENDLGVKEDR